MTKLKQVVECQCAIKELELTLERKKTKQREIMDSITLEDIEDYTYEQLSTIISYFSYKDDEKSKSVKSIYRNKKLEKYPILKTAYHYPELMKLNDKFSDEFLKVADEVLYNTGFNEYLLSDSNTKWCERIFNNKSSSMDLNYKFKLSKDEWFVLLDFLKENGIVEYKYTLYDEESSCKSKSITDCEYEMYKKNIGDFNSNDYYEIWLYKEDDRFDDEEKEIYTKEQFEKLKKLVNAKMCKRGISESEAIQQYISN